MNDCSDHTNIRLRKFSISACCSIVILILWDSYSVGNDIGYDVALDTIKKYLKDTLFPTLKL